jgi:hypothetical protein
MKNKYTVWVGGTEVNDRLLSKNKAKELASVFHDYDDVVVEKITTSYFQKSQEIKL